MANKSIWTAELTTLGLPRWVRGDTLKEIASFLNISESAVHKYSKSVWPVRELKRSKFQWSSADEESLKKLVLQNVSISQMTKIFRRSDKSIRVKIAKLGLFYEYRKCGWSEEEDTILRESYDSVKSLSDLAKQLGRSTVTISSRASALGLRRTRGKHLSENFHGTSVSAKASWSNAAERKKKTSETMTEYWSDPDKRKEHSKKLTEYFKSDEVRLKRSEVF